MANDFVCCGRHAVCEHDALLDTEDEVEYFDDEELDRFRLRPADAYSAAEEEEFREVVYTMRVNEVGDWLHSLEKRNIELPEGLRDEVLMLMSESH